MYFETSVKCRKCGWEGKPKKLFQSYEESVNNRRYKKLKEILNERI